MHGLRRVKPTFEQILECVEIHLRFKDLIWHLVASPICKCFPYSKPKLLMKVWPVVDTCGFWKLMGQQVFCLQIQSIIYLFIIYLYLCVYVHACVCEYGCSFVTAVCGGQRPTFGVRKQSSLTLLTPSLRLSLWLPALFPRLAGLWPCVCMEWILPSFPSALP